MPGVGAIVVAAGRGKRFGEPKKQYADLAGIPILERSMRAFQAVDEVDHLVLVLPLGERAVYSTVEGGDTRTASVRAGLGALPDVDIVLVHDAVRPLVSSDLIRRVILAAREYGAAIPVLPPRDTVKQGDWPTLHTIDRKRVWLAQTPQGFRAQLLRRAYAEATSEGTDDAELVERLGVAVTAIPGEEDNIKITTPRDLEICRMVLRLREGAS